MSTSDSPQDIDLSIDMDAEHKCIEDYYNDLHTEHKVPNDKCWMNTQNIHHDNHYTISFPAASSTATSKHSLSVAVSGSSFLSASKHSFLAAISISNYSTKYCCVSPLSIIDSSSIGFFISSSIWTFIIISIETFFLSNCLGNFQYW